MIQDVAIKVNNVSKVYKIYEKPSDRLKEAINPFGRKYHRDFYALKDLSFEVKKGENIGIIGRNGSGKSTLLQIITGVLKPTTGTMTANGRISALLELGTGFNPELTGIENIYLHGTIMGRTKQETEKSLQEVISFADIGEFVYHPVKTYSSGMYIRLAFACAVNVDPDILIIDEALAVGDMQFQLKCIDKMKSFKEQGKTILFVSHSIYQVKNFCDQVIWMMDGQIHLRGDVYKVTELYEDFMKVGFDNQEAPTLPKEIRTDKLTIDKVTFLDSDGRQKESFHFGEPITAVVDYTLHDNMDGIVAGIALFDKQNTYVCGLNTKLDNYDLPSKPGKYQLFLKYHEVNLLPGTYFADIGFFESSAVVQLDYRTRTSAFRINTGEYFAEGLWCIKHNWHCKE